VDSKEIKVSYTPSYYPAMLEMAGALGLGGPLATVRKFADRAAQLNAELGAHRDVIEQGHADVVRRLVGGPLGRTEVEDAAGAVSLWSHDAPAAMAYVAAVAMAHQQAELACAQAAPELFNALAAKVDRVVRTSSELARQLPPEVADVAAAVAARKAEEWVTLGELMGQWRALHQLAGHLRFSGWVPRFDDAADSMYLRYQRPHLLPAAYLRLPGQLQLAIAVDSGSKPGLYSGDEALRRYRAARPVMA
jgi:hypothetical protein